MGNGLFPNNHLVIPTGAQRSGGICGFLFQFSHTLLSPTFVIQEPPICLKNPKKF
jgi:hypothetical protein